MPVGSFFIRGFPQRELPWGAISGLMAAGNEPFLQYPVTDRQEISMMKSKMSDTVYDAILRDIVTGVYLPRDFIREAQIAA